MKSKFLILSIGLILFFSMGMHSVSASKIKWKKIESEEQARAEMDKKIFIGSNYDVDLKILTAEKHDYILGQGDTIIYYHSPYCPVHHLSLVSRKFMFTFHFKYKALQSYTVEKGLMGP
jgi:hypothetical protein